MLAHQVLATRVYRSSCKMLSPRYLFLMIWCLQTWHGLTQSPQPIPHVPLGANFLCDYIKGIDTTQAPSKINDNITAAANVTLPIEKVEAVSPRFRRDWYSLADAEIDLYLSALEESMNQGIYQRFLFYHLDAVSAIQAHDTCAFMLWHRRYLLAIENMLRSLDTKYSCLAVPYWNVMDDHIAQQGRLCDSIAGCSAILRDIGGNTARQSQTRSYGSVTQQGAYYTGRPFSFATDNNGLPGIIRAELIDVSLPSECSMDRVLQTIASHDNYNDFSLAIQRSIHDAVHDAVGGFMPTNASPSDVIFLNWHSTIDLLHFVWLQCHLGDKRDASPTSRFAFTQDGTTCGHTGPGTTAFPFLNSSSEMHMMWLDTDIRDDAIIGRYFQDIGLKFHEMTDARALGEDSFSYELPRRMQQFLASDQCPDSNYQLTPMPTAQVVPTQTPTFRQTIPQSKQEQWIQLIQNRVDNAYPNDPIRREEMLLYLDCILEADSSLRFSNQFVLEFVRGEIVVDTCQHILREEPLSAAWTRQIVFSFFCAAVSFCWPYL